MTFLPLAFVALVLLGCGGAPFQTGEDTRPDLSDAPPASEASSSPSTGEDASSGPSADASTSERSSPLAVGSDSSVDSPDASLDSSPDAESTYARCVAAFIEGCQSDPSACAFVSLAGECGPPPGDT